MIFNGMLDKELKSFYCLRLGDYEGVLNCSSQSYHY
jgi:hypothetical protein